MQYVVISDLHVGAGTSLDIFRSHAALASFLRGLGSAPTRLIVNGDFVDFLAVPPFKEFSRDAAKKKVKKIIEAPVNVPVWQAFAAFLEANDENTVEVLLGNHDVELIFGEVQEALRVAMRGEKEALGARVHFHTDRLSYPLEEIGGVRVHIEHGFQYDPVNWYDRGKLSLSAQDGGDGSAFELPAGSRLVYGVLNGLTTKHPYIPLLKPEPAVFWITAAEEGSSFLKLVKGGPGLIKNTFFSKVGAWRRGTMLRARGGRTGTRAEELERQLAEIFLDRSALSDSDLEDVRKFLRHGRGDEPFGGDGRLRPRPLRWGRFQLMRLALWWLKRSRESFFDPAQGDAFRKGLEDLFGSRVQVAILGHSHGSKMHEVADPANPARSLLYLNTGTWADLLDFDPAILDDGDRLRAWLDTLRNGTYTPRRILTFARLAVREGRRGLTASLERWDGARAVEIDSREVGNG